MVDISLSLSLVSSVSALAAVLHRSLGNDVLATVATSWYHVAIKGDQRGWSLGTVAPPTNQLRWSASELDREEDRV